METEIDVSGSAHHRHSDSFGDHFYGRNKRMKLSYVHKGDGTWKCIDYSDPYAFHGVLDNIRESKYGSVTPEVEDLLARKMQLWNSYLTSFPSTEIRAQNTSILSRETLDENALDVQIVSAAKHAPSTHDVVIIESDDEDAAVPPPNPFQEILLKQAEELLKTSSKVTYVMARDSLKREEKSALKQEENSAIKQEEESGDNKTNDKGVYLGVDDEFGDKRDDSDDAEDENLAGIWNEMNFALEVSKGVPEDPCSDDHSTEDEDCDHSYVLKDDLGYVCRVCGIIQKSIESMIEFQYVKSARTRTYRSESKYNKENEQSRTVLDWAKVSGNDFPLREEIIAHPRHMKQMKPHQIEGFNFLKRNLLDKDSPGGCILAHAPGSGKTFMIISFMQSFLAKCPDGRPLVVLPKPILSTWKKEFQRWQVEDIPLLDFYSVKADGRHQQLEVLRQWKERRSILFLGYKQFSTIVTDISASDITAACQEILLKQPTILILDEGHTPRNENTDVLNSLAKVQTPLKVVLSGTLYQNHVKEVFNVLNLVRPKFLRLDSSRSIKKRILSRVYISGERKQLKSKGDGLFYDLVEETLQQEKDYGRKEMVIKDLREMTSKILHYYKGDFSDELPGLVDFAVLLNLSPKQKVELDKMKKTERAKFRICSVGCAVYLHPKLKQLCDSGERSGTVSDERVDEIIRKVDMKDGVKAKFFMNLLSLCEATGEKLLVFSQYLLPMRFLERLCVHAKGWSTGKEIFVINGDVTMEQRDWCMDKFNNASDARVLFGSIKACGEGISLVGASRIIILDVHLNPSVSRQAIGRAFRPGQLRKVYTYRLVAADSPEEEDHKTCFKKELIAKRWFEWNECSGHQGFELEILDSKDSGDVFLESPHLAEDIKCLHRR